MNPSNGCHRLRGCLHCCHVDAMDHAFVGSDIQCPRVRRPDDASWLGRHFDKLHKSPDSRLPQTDGAIFADRSKQICWPASAVGRHRKSVDGLSVIVQRSQQCPIRGLPYTNGLIDSSGNTMVFIEKKGRQSGSRMSVELRSNSACGGVNNFAEPVRTGRDEGLPIRRPASFVDHICV